MFVGLGVSGVVPVVHALTIYGFEELNPRMGLSWVLLQGVLYILGAFIYAVSDLVGPDVDTCRDETDNPADKMAGEIVSGDVRHLGQLPSDFPRSDPVCCRFASLRHGQGIRFSPRSPWSEMLNRIDGRNDIYKQDR